MVNSSSSSPLHFPSKEALSIYLKQHPETRDRQYRELKIVQAVAHHFAHTRRSAITIKEDVYQTLFDLNRKLKLSTFTVMRISLCFERALRDYAQSRMQSPLPTPSALRFPSKGVILFFLQSHPKTCNSHFDDHRILGMAADIFAQTQCEREAIKDKLCLMMEELSEWQSLPRPVVTAISNALAEALEDCARTTLCDWG